MIVWRIFPSPSVFPAGFLHPSGATISLLDTHRRGEGETLGVSRAPRVLQALRRNRMTFNLGSEEQTAAKDLQEYGPRPSPQVIITAGHHL